MSDVQLTRSTSQETAVKLSRHLNLLPMQSTRVELPKVLDEILELIHSIDHHFANKASNESESVVSKQLSALILVLAPFRDRIAVSSRAQVVQTLAAEGGRLERLHTILARLKERILSDKFTINSLYFDLEDETTDIIREVIESLAPSDSFVLDSTAEPRSSDSSQSTIGFGAPHTFSNAHCHPKEAFEKSLQNIYDRPDTETRLALQILIWVTCAHRLLRLSELQDVLTVTTNAEPNMVSRDKLHVPSEETIVDLCAGLIMFDNDHRIQFVHHTAQEYFDSIKDMLWPTAQLDMATVCIAYIKPHIYPMNRAEAEAKAQEIADEYPFFDYAIHEWGHHVRASGEAGSITTVVLNLIDNDSNRATLSSMMTYDPMRSPRSTSWSALHFCAFFDLHATFAQLLRKHIPMKQQIYQLASLLSHFHHHGLPKKHNPYLDMILDMCSDYDKTPFSVAVSCGSMYNARVSLPQKQCSFSYLDLDIWDDYDKTPLSVAASCGSTHVAQMLLACSRVVIDSQDHHNRSPLSYAAESGTVDLMRQLLERGADTTFQDIFGQTPLFYAVAARCKEAVHLLFRYPLAPNKKDRMGRTPLSYAAEYGHSDMVELLLQQQDIDINTKDSRGRTPLFYSSMGGHVDTVMLLLSRSNIDVNIATPNGQSSLASATEEGHSGVVSLLLGHKGIAPNLCDNMGRTPLSSAAYNGTNLAIVRSLLAHPDMDVEIEDKYGFTALTYASAREDEQEEMVKLLLEEGRANSNPKDHFDQTPLLYAASRGHGKIVELLLGVGADPRPQVDQTLSWSNGATALNLLLAQFFEQENSITRRSREQRLQTFLKSHLGQERSTLSQAAIHGWMAVMQWLLSDPNIDADARDSQGMTPLIHAAKEGHDKVAALLLSRKDVNVNLMDCRGRGALSYALSGGHTTVVQLLLDLSRYRYIDLDVDVPDSRHRAPISYAAETQIEAIYLTLFDCNAVDINRPDSNRRTPLSYAASYNNTSMMDLLLARNGIEVNLRDTSGKSALCYAASNGNVQAVNALLRRHDVDADCRDNLNRTPMCHAAKEGHSEVVSLLLARDDVATNPTDFESRTPLLFAARNGHTAVVRQLLSRPDVAADAKDDNLRTPLSYAAQGGDVQIVKLLLARQDVDPKSSDYLQDVMSYAADMEYKDVLGWRPYFQIMRAISRAGAT